MRICIQSGYDDGLSLWIDGKHKDAATAPSLLHFTIKRKIRSYGGGDREGITNRESLSLFRVMAFPEFPTPRSKGHL